jgi:hypothetical protein
MYEHPTKKYTNKEKRTKQFFLKKRRQKHTPPATKDAKNDSSLNLQSPISEEPGPPS